MARFHEFPDDAALGLRDGLLDFQGFQGVRVPVLNNLGNRLRQRLGGAEVDQGGRRGRRRLMSSLVSGSTVGWGVTVWRGGTSVCAAGSAGAGSSSRFPRNRKTRARLPTTRKLMMKAVMVDAFFIGGECMKKGQAFKASSNLA